MRHGRPGWWTRWTLLLSLAGLFPASAQVLKLATVAPEGSAWMTEMRAAAQASRAATAGRVSIKLYPGGVMGNDATVLKKIRLGQLQGGALTGSELSVVYRDAPIYGLPFLFRDANEVATIRAALDTRLAEGLAANGFQLLSMNGVGFAYLMSSGDLGSREAIESRKVWVPNNDLISERTFRAGGIAPIPLALPDVYTALQTGLIDTVGNTPSGAIALQWHGALRQVLDLPLAYVTAYVVVSGEAWSRLSEADQRAVLAAFTEAGRRLDAGNQRADSEAMQALLSLGVQKVAPAPGERERWDAIGQQTMHALAREGALSEDLLAELLARLQALREGAAATPRAAAR